MQWLRRADPGPGDDSLTSRRRGVHGGRYVTLHKGVDRVDVIVTSSGTTYESTLMVDNVRAADTGLYICSLSNAAGPISSTDAYLTVYAGTLFCRAVCRLVNELLGRSLSNFGVLILFKITEWQLFWIYCIWSVHICMRQSANVDKLSNCRNCWPGGAMLSIERLLLYLSIRFLV